MKCTMPKVQDVRVVSLASGDMHDITVLFKRVC